MYYDIYIIALYFPLYSHIFLVFKGEFSFMFLSLNIVKENRNVQYKAVTFM